MSISHSQAAACLSASYNSFIERNIPTIKNISPDQVANLSTSETPPLA